MSGWRFHCGFLDRKVNPKRGRPYIHRCPLDSFQAICHSIDEHETSRIEEVAGREDLPVTQVATTMAFLLDWGLVERVWPRTNERTEKSIFLSAMTCLFGLNKEA